MTGRHSMSCNILCIVKKQSPSPLLLQSIAVICNPLSQISAFSTTTSLSLRQKPHKKRRHGNPHRGESALRRTGLRYPVGMSKEPLPQPVLDPARRSKIEGDPNHGLWGFFNSEKKAVTDKKTEEKHGVLDLCM